MSAICLNSMLVGANSMARILLFKQGALSTDSNIPEFPPVPVEFKCVYRMTKLAKSWLCFCFIIEMNNYTLGTRE